MKNKDYISELKLDKNDIEKYQIESVKEFNKVVKDAIKIAERCGFKINKLSKMTDGRYDSIWYGGEMLKLENDKIAVSICAYGDVEADLGFSNTLASIKDRSNGGYFEGEFGPYLLNDEAFYEACDNGAILLINNNWWEVCVLRKDSNVWIDDGAGVLDESTMVEILKNLDAIIEWANMCYEDDNK